MMVSRTETITCFDRSRTRFSFASGPAGEGHCGAMSLVCRVLWGLAASLAIALYARRRRALSPSGAAAALAIGTTIFAGGGAPWFAALVVFFVTSTLLGKVGRARKEAVKREFSKGDTRDAWQALANGGVAALAALAMLIAPAPAWAAAFLGALATANGDTWATELGVLSRGEPISLVRLARVPRGTSGAVSPLGLAATAGGAAAIGLVAALAPRAFQMAPLRALATAVIAGTLGSLVDSLLGATVQAGFRCAACARDTEGELHHCGNRAEHVRGLRGFGNDLVNVTATLAGALIAIAIH
jgi:uncharacterized protein (TIGR00297 family)